MTEAEIVATIRRIRFTPAIDRCRYRYPGIQTVARLSGVTTPTLYAIAINGTVSWQLRRKLSRALKTLQDEGAFSTLSEFPQGSTESPADQAIRPEFRRFR